MNRVLLLVVDGCTPRVLGSAIRNGDLPLLAELEAAGSLHLDCVSIFPSITPAATASIATGEYPNRHGIAGMSWWNPRTQDVTYYGDDVRTVLQRGIGEFVTDFLVGLNHERLMAPTLFQLAERQQRRAACFNFIIFRGDARHEIRPPLLFRLLPSIGSGMTLLGPSWLCLGDFVSSGGPGHELEAPGGVFNRFGLDDAATAALLEDIPGPDALPDFSLAYFPDYDFDSHDRGPDGALDTLRRLDGRLREIFDRWGGLDRVLADTCVMLTADHSHSVVDDGPEAAIVLEDLLEGYRLADPTTGWNNDEQLLLCPNMRSAEIYLRQPRTDMTREVCAALLLDARVDQVIWRDPNEDGANDFYVATSDRGTLRLQVAAPGAAGAVLDEYGGTWQLDGELGALDLRVDGDGRVHYGAYPNALERIAAGVDHPRSGRVWVTARPGFEFRAPGQQVHVDAGSHGTLHAQESLVPLLVAGAGSRPTLARTPRIVDVAPLCAEIIGISAPIGVGAARR